VQQEKLSILINILGKYKKSSSELLFFCPYCKHHKQKFSLNIDKNVYKCWVCDSNGRDIRRVVRRFGAFLELQQWDKYTGKVDISKFDDIFTEEKPGEKVEQRLSLPEGLVSLASEILPKTAMAAKKYLNSRGVTKEDIVRWKVGYCLEGEYANRIIVPSFGESGYANYFVARSYIDSGYRYKNPPASRDMVFNHLYIDWDEDLVIVEGVFDAIVAGPNAVPILGSNLRENSVLFQEIVKHDTPIYIALDPDMEKKALKLINKMLSYGVELYKVQISPYDDVGEMTKEEFQRRKAKSAPFDSESYMMHQMLSSF